MHVRSTSVDLHKVHQSNLRRGQEHITAVWSDACIGLRQSTKNFQMQCQVACCNEGRPLVSCFQSTYCCSAAGYAYTGCAGLLQNAKQLEEIVSRPMFCLWAGCIAPVLAQAASSSQQACVAASHCACVRVGWTHREQLCLLKHANVQKGLQCIIVV